MPGRVCFSHFDFFLSAGAVELEFHWSPLSSLFHTCSSLQAQTHKPRDSQIINLAIDVAPTLHNPAVPPPREASRTSLMDHGKRPGWMQRSLAPPCHDKCDDFPKSWWALRYSPENLGIDDPFPVEEMDVIWCRLTSQPCAAGGLGCSQHLEPAAPALSTRPQWHTWAPTMCQALGEQSRHVVPSWCLQTGRGVRNFTSNYKCYSYYER